MSITKKETATEQDDSTKKASIEEATKEKVEPTADENSVNKDSWERLMGDDLLMKVGYPVFILQLGQVRQNRDILILLCRFLISVAWLDRGSAGVDARPTAGCGSD
jgi:hypothetical protein